MADKKKEAPKQEKIDPKLQALMEGIVSKSDNSLGDVADLLTQLAKEAPGLTERMLAYLGMAGKMPSVGFSYLGENTSGEYDSSTNKVTMAGQNPSTLAHELTHAVRSAMSTQASVDKNMNGKEEATKTFTGFTKSESDSVARKILDSLRDVPAGYVEALLGGSRLGDSVRQNSQYSNYRTSSAERQPWGVGEAVNPSKSIDPYDSSGHLNATMATEFEILLDLMTRRLKTVRQEEANKPKELK